MKFTRKEYSKLLSWKAKKSRKPLVVSGVRQSGKSFLVEWFGKEEFRRLWVFDFEKNKHWASYFQENIDPKEIIRRLNVTLDEDIDLENDLIFFDEIQAAPRVLTSLKYFYQDLPNSYIIAAGSLLGLELSNDSFPVGKVEQWDMYPLSFFEFLSAIKENRILNFLQECNWSSQQTIPENIHNKAWDLLKEYLYVGGTPESIITYINSAHTSLNEQMSLVREQQEQLLKAYYRDIAKHAGKENSMHISRVFESIPIQLAKSGDYGSSKYKFKGVLPNRNRYSQLAGPIDWLKKAGLVLQTHLINNVNIPLKAHRKENSFKLYHFDVGLLGHESQINPTLIKEFSFGNYKGYFAENFVLQQLKTDLNSPIYCWTRNKSEIEFLIQGESSTIPIEVKSGNNRRSKSLHSFVKRYSPDRALVFSARSDIQQIENVTYVPLYLVNNLYEYLQY